MSRRQSPERRCHLGEPPSYSHQPVARKGSPPSSAGAAGQLVGSRPWRRTNRGGYPVAESGGGLGWRTRKARVCRRTVQLEIVLSWSHYFACMRSLEPWYKAGRQHGA